MLKSDYVFVFTSTPPNIGWIWDWKKEHQIYIRIQGYHNSWNSEIEINFRNINYHVIFNGISVMLANELEREDLHKDSKCNVASIIVDKRKKGK